MSLGAEYIGMMMALLIELCLFAFHLHGRDVVDKHIHMLLVYTIAGCIVATGLELQFPQSINAALARYTYCICISAALARYTYCICISAALPSCVYLLYLYQCSSRQIYLLCLFISVQHVLKIKAGRENMLLQVMTNKPSMTIT